jgi:hypothetical protein
MRWRPETSRNDARVMGNIRSVRELEVYETAMKAAMEIFERTKAFPQEEKYSIGRPDAPVVPVGVCEHR